MSHSPVIWIVLGSGTKDLVTDIFWEEDAATILALPVHEGMDDIMAWHYDAKGGFSLKSACKVHCDDSLRTSR